MQYKYKARRAGPSGLTRLLSWSPRGSAPATTTTPGMGSQKVYLYDGFGGCSQRLVVLVYRVLIGHVNPVRDVMIYKQRSQGPGFDFSYGRVICKKYKKKILYSRALRP